MTEVSNLSNLYASCHTIFVINTLPSKLRVQFFIITCKFRPTRYLHVIVIWEKLFFQWTTYLLAIRKRWNKFHTMSSFFSIHLFMWKIVIFLKNSRNSIISKTTNFRTGYHMVKFIANCLYFNPFQGIHLITSHPVYLALLLSQVI